MNLLSLLLGIAALVFALHSIQVKGCLICSTLSGACCSASLLCQLVDNDRIARMEDIAAILDTAHAVPFEPVVQIHHLTIDIRKEHLIAKCS